MNMQNYSDTQLIELIQKDPENLREVYNNTKKYCLNFLRNLSFGSNIVNSDLEDIYSDSLIVLYENIVKGNFKLSSSIQTYLNSVCRNQLLNKFKKKLKEKPFMENQGSFDDSISDVLEKIPDQKELKFVAMERAMEEIKKAGGHCFQILRMFWYQKKSMKDITEYFEYTNADNAKNQKARCQKRLKTLTLKILKKIK